MECGRSTNGCSLRRPFCLGRRLRFGPLIGLGLFGVCLCSQPFERRHGARDLAPERVLVVGQFAAPPPALIRYHQPGHVRRRTACFRGLGDGLAASGSLPPLGSADFATSLVLSFTPFFGVSLAASFVVSLPDSRAVPLAD